MCHAELNAVLNRNHATSTGCILYATMFPCNECAKVLIQAGIKEVIYFSDKKKGTPANEASKTMFTKAGILFRYVLNYQITISGNSNRLDVKYI